MAKLITQATSTVLSGLTSGRISVEDLTVYQAVLLAQSGYIGYAGTTVCVTTKGGKALSRFRKRRNQQLCNNEVEAILADVLEEDGACTQHRAVWLKVGQENFSRAEVLTALQHYRSTGYLKSFRQSGNNFQVFWALGADEPEAAEFGTIAQLGEDDISLNS